MKSVNLRRRIKELRRRFKITQDRLSKKADIPFSTLAKIEGGYISNPSMETLIKIADALGIGIDDLLGRRRTLYRRQSLGKGFTLVELIMVMAIIAILAFVAVERMPDMASMRLDMAARKVHSDMRYAQSLAVSTQRWTGVFLSAANDSYSVYIDSLDDGTSNPSSWSIAIDPLTKEDYTIQLNNEDFTGVDLTTVYFNGNDNYLVFDRWGNPYSYTGSGAPAALANPAYVRLSAASATVDVVADRGTGRIYIQ